MLNYDLVRQALSAAPYADALFYLSDARYQQGSLISAKVYLRDLLSLKAAHYREALARYLEIAGRLDEFHGIEEFIEQARQVSGGELAPELAYVYGKWLFRRSDLPKAERAERARKAFGDIAQKPGAPFRLQSAYYVGVCHVHPALGGGNSPAGAGAAVAGRWTPRSKMANIPLGRSCKTASTTRQSTATSLPGWDAS